MQPAVAVYSTDPELAERLSATCPDVEFVAEGETREQCRIAILDQATSPPRGRSIVQIALVDDTTDAHRAGELRIGRSAFLSAPAEPVHFAIDLARAVQHAARLEKEAEQLRRIQELMTLTDSDAVSERIVRSLLELLGWPQGTLYLHDPRLERYVVSFSNDAATEESEEFLPGIPLPLLQEALNDSRRFTIGESDSGARILLVPLQVDEDLIGVVRIGVPPGAPLEAERADAVTHYARTVSTVISNLYQLTRSRDLAMRDDLTKAFNRRFFESYLDEEIERARRYGGIFSIIFLDLDDLRTVNDQHGHLAGSRVLQEVAKRILGAVRGIDKVVRFGGDEFCIILPQTDQEQAIAVANRVARAIGSSELQLDANLTAHITASFGVASYPAHALTKDSLIRQADAAMYRVKLSTKNAVGVAERQDGARPVTG